MDNNSRTIPSGDMASSRCYVLACSGADRPTTFRFSTPTRDKIQDHGTINNRDVGSLGLSIESVIHPWIRSFLLRPKFLHFLVNQHGDP